MINEYMNFGPLSNDMSFSIINEYVFWSMIHKKHSNEAVGISIILHDPITMLIIHIHPIPPPIGQEDLRRRRESRRGGTAAAIGLKKNEPPKSHGDIWLIGIPNSWMVDISLMMVKIRFIMDDDG